MEKVKMKKIINKNIAIKKLHHNAYRCRDSEVTRKFYEDFLGLPLVDAFEIPVTNKSSSHQESNELNKPCVLFNYWDYHDLWHILSAIGLFGMLMNIYFLDTDTYAIYTTDYNYPVF